MEGVRGQPELLDTLSGVNLGGIHVALAVDRHGMDPVELPGIAAVAPEAADDGAVIAPDDADLVVFAVGTEQIALFRIGPDRDVPNRAIAERVLFEEPLLDERSVLPEYLNAIVDAVADIDQAVIGDLHAMHGIGELLRGL